MNITELAQLKRLSDQAWETLRSFHNKDLDHPVKRELIAIARLTDDLLDDPEGPYKYRGVNITIKTN